MACLCRGRRDVEKHFPHHNWLISILLLIVVNYVGHIMFTPSIYQFVTSPRSPSSDANANENSDRVWPGLGGTDRDYAWTLISFSLFEAGCLPLGTVMMDMAPYTVSILVALFICAISGTVYATATDVWMVILARCLMGSASLIFSSIIYTYIGEVGTVMDGVREKKGKPPRKNLLYLLALLATTFANALLLGVYAAITRIASVNPYRWPGWFLLAVSLSSALVVLLFFTEPRPWTCRRKNKSGCSLRGLGLSMKLRSNTIRQLMVQVFIIASGYVNGQVLAVVFTLVTPVLSHQFGFDVVYTSLFLMAVPVAYFAVVILVVIAERVLKGNNRLMVGLSLIISLCGCALISDWQGISSHPCHNETNATATDVANLTVMVETCEAQSTSSHQCFWNPQSRVTGEYCNTCLPTCLSQQTSLNFYQFNIGVFLTAMGSILGYIFNNALNSDITPANNQGCATALLVASNALSRAITPFWYVESYEQSGKHTFFPMAITIGSILVMLLALVTLYNILGPKKPTAEIQAVNSTPGHLNMEQELSTGSNGS